MNPALISIGNNVWIDRNAVLIAGRLERENILHRLIAEVSVKEGEISIGDNSHIGIGTIIQGHAGVAVGENFTSSAYCCLYSLSNNPRLCRQGTVAGEVHYVGAPIVIGKNVWLGLHTVVLGSVIGNDSFVKAYTVLRGIFESGWVIGEEPPRQLHRRFEERAEDSD